MIDITHDPRASLEIQRYHTWRVLRRQTVGEHSAQIVRVMLCVWPEVPRKLLVYAIMHDMPEMIGDLPYPVKRDNPNLKKEYGAAETKWWRRAREQWPLPLLPVLTQWQERFFKICEYLEMWENCLSEERMGNQYATLMTERCILAASKILEDIGPDGEIQLAPAVKKYVDIRMQQEDNRGQLGEQHEAHEPSQGRAGA